MAKAQRPWVYFAAGALTGLFTGTVQMYWHQHQQRLQLDHRLQQVKDLFLREGPIEGSWIEYQSHAYRAKDGRTVAVNYGGITRLEDGQLRQYEFIMDVPTGQLLDIYPLVQR
ncbi:hypothetical protein [Schleiferilactobacillus perolens]|jgi:predicted small secreted protein|uniref:PepSY domain-containing protein n=1 Tax=Schleiferilactobacillus perolens DSM 12744 TaxID=1423792 RepID=A0A0R1NBA9_9LACO|nr:hypothetical protein [Schleiferilactobacillus perolens]KRL14323.1 hypothetical protein FD09_GL001492 [Schleiferilactobacillus perolens DSM 12744]MCI1891353.1 hypothetical protein [Schleiferilactobacillus harbinensis]MCI1912299.1 hypothetical protein [Schleiferilactobacillus harbinensis]MCI2170612.1 hypothetical protein [Schleiferilactobacillus perolens]